MPQPRKYTTAARVTAWLPLSDCHNSAALSLLAHLCVIDMDSFTLSRLDAIRRNKMKQCIKILNMQTRTIMIQPNLTHADQYHFWYPTKHGHMLSIVIWWLKQMHWLRQVLASPGSFIGTLCILLKWYRSGWHQHHYWKLKRGRIDWLEGQHSGGQCAWLSRSSTAPSKPSVATIDLYWSSTLGPCWVSHPAEAAEKDNRRSRLLSHAIYLSSCYAYLF